MKLTIVVEFDHELTPRCQQDVKDAVQDLKAAVEPWGGKVTKADLAKGTTPSGGQP